MRQIPLPIHCLHLPLQGEAPLPAAVPLRWVAVARPAEGVDLPAVVRWGRPPAPAQERRLARALVPAQDPVPVPVPRPPEHPASPQRHQLLGETRRHPQVAGHQPAASLHNPWFPSRLHRWAPQLPLPSRHRYPHQRNPRCRRRLRRQQPVPVSRAAGSEAPLPAVHPQVPHRRVLPCPLVLRQRQPLRRP